MKFADLWAKPEPPAPTAAPTAAPDAEHARRYALAALAKEQEILAATPEGGRNHQLNTSAFSCAQLIPHITEEEIRSALGSAAASIGLTPGEIRATLTSGIGSGQKTPRIIPAPAVPDPQVREVAAQALTPDSERDFWQARDILKHIRRFAYARMTAPWAVLGGCLLRAVGAIRPHIVLPPTVGGVGSLNLLVGLVGPSGAGKGASEAAASDACTWPMLHSAPLGSGEGITHAYAHPKPAPKKGEPPHDDPLVWDHKSVLFTSPEIDQVAAIQSRRGSTLMAQLRSAYSGERLGMQYADSTRRIILPAHSYRLGLSVGIQPERADWLLADTEAGGGTPQRFLWLPVIDPRISATPLAAPDPWPWTAPLAAAKQIPGASQDRHGRVLLSIPEEATQQIREAHAARARGEGDALDGHSLYTRLKVAAALAALECRLQVLPEDWDLSQTIMAVSDATRAMVQAKVKQRLNEIEEGRAKRDARRQVIAEETLTEEGTKRVMRVIARALRTKGQLPRHAARKSVTSRDRHLFEEALARLVETGQVNVSEGERGEVLTWN
uniref:Polymerase/primase n=1 Tax=Dulem virus 32 TaxID=3145750 RepID=A0AAU8B0R3_9CAUD